MASKRSRATFEADLQAQQSPYVLYGTPLAPRDESVRDDGSYVPLWKQEVTDEQGRKRLHGAFTGGFSAGYFNTVGSKDGWTPSTFVSSRTKRRKDGPQAQQRPEDFMDEEDRADAEEAKKLQTADTFAGLGSTDAGPSEGTLMDLMKPVGETVGVRLLKKMGWREGQGVGPKVRRKARLEEEQLPVAPEGEDMNDNLHLFAPTDSEMVAFVQKKDRMGLGYHAQPGLADIGTDTGGLSAPRQSGVEEGDGDIGTLKMEKKSKKGKKGTSGGMGMGILNDMGSDDEDPYSMGPSISYNRVIGGSKKKKEKTEALRSTSANPLLSNKPVFISKKASAAKDMSRFRRCHDGRLPLDGFVLSNDSDLRSAKDGKVNDFPPPKIPEGWTSSKSISKTTASSISVPKSDPSAARVAATANLSPKSRAAILGEVQLPGKSVFDYLNPAARSRIATASNNHKLPPALSEADSALPAGSTKKLASLVPQLSREAALTALGRGTAGWMPYSEDLDKRARYQVFLEVHASVRPEGTLPDRAPGASNDDWVKEMNEFAHAAEIFKPITGAMASRFTSSSSAPKLASDNVKLEGSANGTEQNPSVISQPAVKAKSPAEEAASLGMYGPLTRSVEKFYPSRLLCKRFNVKPPSHVQTDANDTPSGGSVGGDGPDGKERPPTHSTAVPQKRLELVGKKDMEDLRISGGVKVQADRAPSAAEQVESTGVRESVAIDPERNEALEKERPEEAVFRAIFGSDSEDD